MGAREELPTQADSVIYHDRDQQAFPFATEQPNPKLKAERPEVRAARERRETEELFSSFTTVLSGRDVSIDQKRHILKTILNNYKTGNANISNLSETFLTDLFLHGLRPIY